MRLHLLLDEGLRILGQFIPDVLVHHPDADGVAHGQAEQRVGDLGPLGLVARHRAGDAAVDDALLERRHHLAEGDRDAGRADGGGEIALRGALHADLLALEIVDGLDVAAAKDDLLREGEGAQDHGAVLLLHDGLHLGHPSRDDVAAHFEVLGHARRCRTPRSPRAPSST